MKAMAVVIERPEELSLQDVALLPPQDNDVVVDIAWSGISTGTERLLWSGRMPNFPGMGYPLVPGYESVGRIAFAGASSGRQIGEQVFVPGARCFKDVRGLFGGAASRLVIPAQRALPVGEALGEQAALLALAATAYHATAGASPPDLIVGHGVLGRLLARLAVAQGGVPTVWESNESRRTGSLGYQTIDPAEDARHDYRVICDVSGDSGILDALIRRLAPGGEIVLAGFYSAPLGFAFPPAFMREARIRVAAEWKEPDLVAVRELMATGKLSLDGLITHVKPAKHAKEAYRTAFDDPACLKMILDWSSLS
jgi:3-hydroxyethyl bacteriochlorophyllide a dehydrogenase